MSFIYAVACPDPDQTCDLMPAKALSRAEI